MPRSMKKVKVTFKGKPSVRAMTGALWWSVVGADDDAVLIFITDTQERARRWKMEQSSIFESHYGSGHVFTEGPDEFDEMLLFRLRPDLFRAMEGRDAILVEGKDVSFHVAELPTLVRMPQRDVNNNRRRG